MVRPRFAKLAPEQRQAILQAALDEFATHGFHDASLNRVIEAAGISKGSMYYYFDGKEDLYGHVARTQLEGLFDRLGPFQGSSAEGRAGLLGPRVPVPSDDDADAFWSTLEDYYLRLISALIQTPQLAALFRGWIAAANTPALQQAQRDMEQAVGPWFADALSAGQRAGAVRSDLPPGLLIAIVLGMGQAMDIWLLTEEPARDDLPRLVASLIGMIRRAVSPA